MVTIAVATAGYFAPTLLGQPPEAVVEHFLDSVRSDELQAAYGDLDGRYLATSETSAELRTCDGVEYLNATNYADSFRTTLSAADASVADIPDYRIDDSVSFVVDGETVHRVVVRFAGFDTDDQAVTFTLQHSWNGWFITAIANSVQDDGPGCGVGFLPYATSDD